MEEFKPEAVKCIIKFNSLNFAKTVAESVVQSSPAREINDKETPDMTSR